MCVQCVSLVADEIAKTVRVEDVTNTLPSQTMAHESHTQDSVSFLAVPAGLAYLRREISPGEV